MATEDVVAPGAAGGPGRRERLRRETFAELDRAAMAEVREHGAVALSLRRVARRMGMSPAGLYRYVDSREALLTRLIATAYHDLADHLERAHDEGDEPGASRLRAVALTYRRWAVAHPHEFGLLFGDPIPGYEAPPGGRTVVAMARVGRGLGRPLLDAWRDGRLRLLTHAALPADVAQALAPMSDLGEPELPAEVAWTLLLVWGRLHGPISLEVFGHHAWLFPDGCEPLYRAEVERLVVDLGLGSG